MSWERAAVDRIFVKDSLRLLLDRLGRVEDPREPCKVKFPLREVLFLVTSATIAGCDDYDEIVDWGNERLDFLREYGEFYFGIPKEDWLRVVMNRIDPALFEACFLTWVDTLRPHDGREIIALDGKTVRRSGDSGQNVPPVHLVSAWASSQRLVLAQEAVAEKTNECAAIQAILERLSVTDALVTIDAVAATPAMAEAITEAGGDYVLALKRNQPSLHADVAAYFDDPDTHGLASITVTDKDHGRLESRTYTVSHDVAWLAGDRRYPGEPRFPSLHCLIRTTTRSERRGKVSEQTRYFISSAPLSPERAAEAIRGHWGIESLHWVLDVIFKEDLSRLRRGHGAKNMALVRRFAFNLVRLGRGKTSIKTARKRAGWNPNFLRQILQAKPR
jgi:predicted transposase YbfD/YdcC